LPDFSYQYGSSSCCKLPESLTSFPPRALGTPGAIYSTLRCPQLLISPTLWVNHQDRHSSPDPRHPSILQLDQARPSPPVATRHATALHSSSGRHCSAGFSSKSPSPSSSLQTRQMPPLSAHAFRPCEILKPLCPPTWHLKSPKLTCLHFRFQQNASPYASPMPPSSSTPSRPPISFRPSDPTDVPTTTGRPRPTSTSTGPLSPDHS
jgi:hypothetical protein